MLIFRNLNTTPQKNNSPKWNILTILSKHFSTTDTRQTLTLCISIFLVQAFILCTKKGISSDEAISLFYASQAALHDLSFILNDIHCTLYNFFLTLIVSIFGSHLFLARAFSIIPSLFTFFYTKKMLNDFFHARFNRYVLPIIAFSPLIVFYSSHVRTYSLFIALSTISSYYYLRLFKTPIRQNFISYAFVCILSLYSHIIGFLLIFIQFTHFFIFKKKSVKEFKLWIGCSIIIGLAYGPIIYAILSKFNLARDIPLIYNWARLPNLIKIYKGYIFLSGSLILSLLYLPILIWGFFLSRKIKKTENYYNYTYLIFWFVGPEIILLISSYIYHPIYIFRGFSSSALPLCLLIGISITYFPLRTKWKNTFLILLITLSLIKSFHHDGFSLSALQPKLTQELLPNDVSSQNQGRHITMVYPPGIATAFLFMKEKSCFFAKDVEQCIKEKNILILESIPPTLQTPLPGQDITLFIWCGDTMKNFNINSKTDSNKKGYFIKFPCGTPSEIQKRRKIRLFY